ncbi:MAG: hypothetical protein KAT75_03840, partial [Dehalococcoidia bacterium]|nr:hypothetical protein [Dehalococcoidia bacterium]
MTDIAVSPEDSGYHYVGIVGDGGALAAAWYYKLGAIGATWTAIAGKNGFGSTVSGVVDPSDNALAIAFSPSFASDKLLLAVTDNQSANKVLLEAYSFNHDAWNEDAAYEDYPAIIETEADITDVAYASIALAPDYEGGDPAFRIAFIGLDVNAGDDSDNDGIYRMKDTTDKNLKEGVDIFSIAYDGTNLVAGQNSSNGVYYSSDPLASSPTVSGTSQYKRLQGAKVIVAWAGSDVLAATSQSGLTGFGASHDNGKSFSGLSLMDYGTNGLEVADLAVSADGSVIYLMTTASSQATYVLWRKASDWEMVFSRAITLGNPPYVRVAPDDAEVVFITEDPGNAKTMFY